MKKLLLILCVTGSFHSANAMLTQKAGNKASGKLARYFTKEKFKKGFSKGMTGLHWYLSAGYLFQTGFEKIKEIAFVRKNCDSYEHPNQKVSEFILKEMPALQSADNILQSPISLTINTIPQMVTTESHIIIGKVLASEINEALDNNDIKALNEYRGIFQTKNQHIKNKDIYIQILACLALPLMTHWYWKGLSSSLKFGTKVPSFARQQFSKITTGMGKGLINSLAYNKLNNYQIQQADDGLNDDIKVLRGLKRVLEASIDARRRIFFETYETAPNVSPEKIQNMWEQNLEKEQANILPTLEPTMSSRIEKLEERISLLRIRKNVDHCVEMYRRGEQDLENK